MRKLMRFLFYANGAFSIGRTIATSTITAGIVVLIVAALTGNAIAAIAFMLVAVMLAGFMRRTSRIRKAKTERIKADKARTSNPALLGPYLLPDESKVNWEGRSHPVALTKWWALICVSPIVSITISALSGHWILLPILWAALSAAAWWRVLNWKFEWRAITNNRIIEVNGVFNRHGPGIELKDLEYVDPIDTFLGRRLGYRHFKFDTASQSDPFNWLRYVPTPRGTNEGTRVHAFLRRINPDANN